MNYKRNTTQWKIGDLVIHDADAKEERMLMRVIGYRASDGLCETEYIDPEMQKLWGKHRKLGRLFNGINFLHDPARFGLKAQVTP